MCFYRSTIKDAKLWSVKSPTLYTVTVDVMDSSSGKLLDSTNYSVGVRTLVYSNKGLTLNDEVRKRLFFATFFMLHKPNIYQARLGTNTFTKPGSDKHRENSQKACFLTGGQSQGIL